MSRLVAICIATYHRPEPLRALLESLSRLEVPASCRLELRIVDNDASGSASTVIEELSPRLPGKVLHEVEPEQGISKARNRALEMGRADLVATIDDDETAEPRWLVELVDTLDETGADAVFGSVAARYPANAPRWLVRGRFLDKSPGPRGRPLRWNETSTCNALVRGEWFFLRGFRFDLAYGRTGGEDTSLFARLERAGARFVSAERAVVHEDVPLERTTLARQLRVAWRKTIAYHRTRSVFEPRFELAFSCAMIFQRGLRATLATFVGLALALAGRLEFLVRALVLWTRLFAGIAYLLAPERTIRFVAYAPRPKEASRV